MAVILAVVGVIAAVPGLGGAAAAALAHRVAPPHRREAAARGAQRRRGHPRTSPPPSRPGWTGHLGEALAVCGAGGAAVAGRFEDGTPYVVLPDDGAAARQHPAGRPGLVPGGDRSAPGGSSLPGRALFPLEVYGGRQRRGRRAARVCRAVLADGDLRLGRGCWSLRWLHARGHAAGARVLRAARARLGGRLHAARGGLPLRAPARPERRLRRADGRAGRRRRRSSRGAAKDVPRPGRGRRGPLARPAAKLEIPAGIGCVTSDIVVTGELAVGAGTQDRRAA